ncbi:sulfite exporter TauE/SafE family protein [Candidatus Microgenomates bacterium]|nr:sulfite exporter TauE/SafE family protein [Candidatus Microgenomates bacterium]
MENVSVLILTFIASAVGTMTGFGTSTILVPVLSLQYPLAETLLFVGIVHWFGDIWKMLFFKRGANWKLILLFGVAGIIVSFVGARLAGVFPEDLLKKLLGGFLIAYVAFVWIKPKWKLPKSNTNALVGGGLSGFFSGIFGVGGAIRSTFLSAYNLDKSVFLFTSGAIGLLIDSSRLVGYVTGDIRLKNYSIPILITALVISLIGAYVAKIIVNKIPQEKFRLVIAIALFFVGLRYLFF